MANALRTIAAAGSTWIMILMACVGCAARPAHRLTVGVAEAPAAAEEQVIAVLRASGYEPAGKPAWAGAAPAWQAPGDYRVFFAATGAAATDSASPQDGTDIYAADLRIDGAVQVANQPQVRRLTDTPAGDEMAPILVGDWLAFTTHVGGRIQSVTGVVLADTDQRKLFMFRDPPQQVALRWRLHGASPALVVETDEAGSGAAFAVDLASGAVEPPAGNLVYVLAVRGEQAWLPNLVSRVRELPFVGSREDRLPGKRVFHPDRSRDPGCASIDGAGAGCPAGDGIWQPKRECGGRWGAIAGAGQGHRSHRGAACPCDHRYTCRA